MSDQQVTVAEYPDHRVAPDEVLSFDRHSQSYKNHRQKTDYRDPYRIPHKYLAPCKGINWTLDLPETPLIAFVNGRSGGRAGDMIVDVFNKGLGHTQVFDVTEYRPDVVLKQFWSILESYEGQDADAGYIKSNVRIIVAGGDGTVTWVLGTIASLGLHPAPPVAIMPLGTGNDLSINLGWGKKFVESWVKANHIYDTLLQYSDAHVQSIDYWNMTATCPDSSFYKGLPHSVCIDKSIPTIVRSKFWNYFSVGLDAEAAYNFHSLREHHPRLASSRMMNQAWYSVFTCGTGWFCGARPLERFVSVRVKDSPESDWREVPIPSSIRALVLLNLQTYGGGRDIWGLDNEKNLAKKKLKPPSYDDGLIEVVGFRNGWHTAMVMGEINSKSIHAKRLAQCCAIELKLQVPAPHASMKKFLYMQLDGEPWKQQVPVHVPSSSPETQQTCTVVIEHGGKSSMLVNKDHCHGDRKVKSIIDRAQATAPSV